MLLCGMVLYFLAVRTRVLYPVMTFTGLFLIARSVSLLFGRGSISTISTPDSFSQCEKIIPTPYSVNLSYKYRYEGRARSG